MRGVPLFFILLRVSHLSTYKNRILIKGVLGYSHCMEIESFFRVNTRKTIFVEIPTLTAQTSGAILFKES